MMKAAKLAHQACLPDEANPAVIPTRFDSAMPTLKKRSGNFFAKISVRVELLTSPSTTTTAASTAPSCASARPKASRVDLPSFMAVSQGRDGDVVGRPSAGASGNRREANAMFHGAARARNGKRHSVLDAGDDARRNGILD